MLTSRTVLVGGRHVVVGAFDEDVTPCCTGDRARSENDAGTHYLDQVTNRWSTGTPSIGFHKIARRAHVTRRCVSLE